MRQYAIYSVNSWRHRLSDDESLMTEPSTFWNIFQRSLHLGMGLILPSAKLRYNENLFPDLRNYIEIYLGIPISWIYLLIHEGMCYATA